MASVGHSSDAGSSLSKQSYNESLCQVAQTHGITELEGAPVGTWTALFYAGP